MIKLLRIDHRLLHGQVAFSWAQQLNSDAILLANNELVNDPLRQNIIKFAKPAGVKVIAKTLDESISAIKSGITDKYKLFIIVEKIEDAKYLIENLGLKEVNLGGTYPKEGSENIATAIHVDEDDKRMLREMVSNGVDVYIQGVPSSKKIFVKDII